MARPKKDVKSLKAIVVSFRLNVDKYLELSDNTESLGMSIPNFVRKKISGKILKRRRYSTLDRKVLIELSRIGNNINQLIRQGNLGMRNPLMLSEQLMELKNLLDSIKYP